MFRNVFDLRRCCCQLVMMADAHPRLARAPIDLDLEYQITADTTDRELEHIAESIIATTLAGEPFPQRQDIRTALVAHRNRERDRHREELAALAALHKDTSRRDAMIARVAGWGDPSRKLGKLVGLSHTEVLRIVRRQGTAEPEISNAVE